TIPLEKRRVLGVITNQHDVRMSGATVSLFSPLDTLHTSTNPNGIFAFDDVRSADFLLTVKMLGYDTYNRKYFNNDTQQLLRIPTIRLGVKVEELEEVTITGMRGSVVRGDTTEFWARDYIVRDFARLRDLLQRMEGITIDAEGSVFHNGQEVTRALFNNETYFSGSVKEAISELPADIVDRVQIIDRSADGETARKLRSEETTKVMNIVTKEDKTRGTMIDLVAEGGTQSRGRVDGNYKRIDGPHQRQIAAGYREFPDGLQED